VFYLVGDLFDEGRRLAVVLERAVDPDRVTRNFGSAIFNSERAARSDVARVATDAAA
jgi:hypothetical protein